MTFFHFYARQGKLIVPTVAKTDAGFFIDVEPVTIIRLADIHLLREPLAYVFAAERLYARRSTVRAPARLM